MNARGQSHFFLEAAFLRATSVELHALGLLARDASASNVVGDQGQELAREAQNLFVGEPTEAELAVNRLGSDDGATVGGRRRAGS